MKWEYMAVKSAVRAVTRMKEGTVPEFELKANYLRMQQRIHEAWAEANAELKAQAGKSGFEYARDLNFGLRLYRIFPGENLQCLRGSLPISVYGGSFRSR